MEEKNIALCPFKGCKGCDRKVEVVQTILGEWFVTSMYKKVYCGCADVQSVFFKTPEEAIDSWNRMVGE